MAVLFGKFSDTIPEQIEKGFYKTLKHELFGSLAPNDLVFAIGNNKVQLWRAIEYKTFGDDKQMDFKIISSDLDISIAELVMFKFFELNTDLVIFTYRQSNRAFFPINLISGFNEGDLLNLSNYKKKENFREIVFVESGNGDVNKLSQENVTFQKNGKWSLINSSFIDLDLQKKFRDNLEYIGFGRPKKDKTLGMINSLSMPSTLTPKEIPFINLYDVFFCDYDTDIVNTEIFGINIYPNKIYKLSHGKDISDEEYEQHLLDERVTVHEDTPSKGRSIIAQGQNFRDARIGDYFYLCKGNEHCELIGQFISQPYKINPNDDSKWFYRDYNKIIDVSKKKRYTGVKKWWTPKENSTFIEIPMKELNIANDILFKPYFQTEITFSKSQYQMEKITKILENKKQIILQGAPGTGKTYTTAEIALRTIGKTDIVFTDRDKVMEAYQQAVQDGQIVFTTFHQSLDYEEFIEGLKPNSVGDQVSYSVESGIFKQLCENASETSSLKELQNAIEEFKNICSIPDNIITLETKEKYKFTVSYRGGVTFRVRSLTSKAEEGIDFPANIKNIEKLYKGITAGVYNKSYVWGILNHLKEKNEIPDYNIDQHTNKKYVLIIDEINRGNISKIFGELISLLEADKRIGQINELKCKLPYSPDEEFGVPDNLYIIGTMNTTDRSLGHIDYAVRRRFAFVNLESELVKVESHSFDKEATKLKAVELYKSIDKLVTENVSPEFQAKDIMVGHSYFMAKTEDDLKLKLEYEIKPLLSEYIKDGLLTLAMDDIENIIDKLSL